MAASAEILVVDDELDLRETVAEYLARHGFRVRTAMDGVAMAARLEEKSADLGCWMNAGAILSPLSAKVNIVLPRIRLWGAYREAVFQCDVTQRRDCFSCFRRPTGHTMDCETIETSGDIGAKHRANKSLEASRSAALYMEIDDASSGSGRRGSQAVIVSRHAYDSDDRQHLS